MHALAVATLLSLVPTNCPPCPKTADAHQKVCEDTLKLVMGKCVKAMTTFRMYGEIQTARAEACKEKLSARTATVTASLVAAPVEKPTTDWTLTVLGVWVGVTIGFISGFVLTK